MGEAMEVFDRRLVRRRRDRAALRSETAGGVTGRLFAEAAEHLADRLDDIVRRFPVALDLGCRRGTLAAVAGGRGGIETIVQCDLSPAMARCARESGRPALAADEEVLPFAGQAFDLIFSSLSLHWVNDLPGALIQIRQVLRPDGLFLGTLLGGASLRELRTVLLEAELAEEGGASPRVSPFVDIRDAGNLLQRAGFALPVADADMLSVAYPDALALLRELRAIGESNALRERRPTFTRRATLSRAAALYDERFTNPAGGVTATFEIIYLTAWAPHPEQQRPLAPGSARGRLADALGEIERSAGDKAGPRHRRGS